MNLSVAPTPMMDKILSDELLDFGGITHLKKYNLNVQNEDGWAGVKGFLLMLKICNIDSDIVVGDTQSDSIQFLNFVKKCFIQYSIQYCFTQDSTQNIIQFQKKSADSIQKMIQFNSQGIMDTGRKGKGLKHCPKSVKNRQEKGAFHQKRQISIQNMIHSFISQ